MMHEFRDKREKSKNKRIIKNIYMILLFAIIIFLFFIFLKNGFLYRIARPFWEAKNMVTNNIDEVEVFVRTKSSVLKDNENLLNENLELRNKMIDYDLLTNENLELKELLNRIPDPKNFVLGTILIKPNYSPYDTLIIDAGSSSLIKQGDKVYANGTIPIGVIDKVYEKSSLVVLYSNPGLSTTGSLFGSNTSVEIIGRGGSNFEMIVPIEVETNRWQNVVSPGLETEILAVIESVISSSTSPVKKVLLRSPINIQSLKWVQVKINESDSI